MMETGNRVNMTSLLGNGSDQFRKEGQVLGKE